jgi:hypothetical protein
MWQKNTQRLINMLIKTWRKTSSTFKLHMIARDFLLYVLVLKNLRYEIERRYERRDASTCLQHGKKNFGWMNNHKSQNFQSLFY